MSVDKDQWEKSWYLKLRSEPEAMTSQPGIDTMASTILPQRVAAWLLADSSYSSLTNPSVPRPGSPRKGAADDFSLTSLSLSREKTMAPETLFLSERRPFPALEITSPNAWGWCSWGMENGRRLGMRVPCSSNGNCKKPLKTILRHNSRAPFIQSMH